MTGGSLSRTILCVTRDVGDGVIRPEDSFGSGSSQGKGGKER